MFMQRSRSRIIKQMEEKFIRHSDTDFILNFKIGKIRYSDE